MSHPICIVRDMSTDLLAHYAEDGPVASCWRFLELVLGDQSDFLKAWHMMSPNLRLCRSQAWLWNNRSHPFVEGHLEALADWLVDYPAGQSHPTIHAQTLWGEFEAIELRTFDEAWQDSYARQLGAASHPRPIGPNLELVLMIPTDGRVIQFDTPTLVTDSLPFVMEFVDGWHVAAFGDRLPVSGWPPDLAPTVKN